MNFRVPCVPVICDSCRKDIARHCRILILNGETNREELELCVGCFVENKQNARKPYRVVGKTDFPIYKESWTAYDEIMLLEGLQYWGFDNWDDVAEHTFEYRKTRQEIRAHYYNFYFLGSSAVEQKRDFCPAQYKKCEERNINRFRFNRFRQEFDHPYNPEAESLIKDLEFGIFFLQLTIYLL